MTFISRKTDFINVIEEFFFLISVIINIKNVIHLVYTRNIKYGIS